MLSKGAVLLRAGETPLTNILGEGVFRVLMALDPELTTVDSLRDLVITSLSMQDIALSREKWAVFVGLLRPVEVEDLASGLGLNSNPDDGYATLAAVNFSKKPAELATLLDLFGESFVQVTDPLLPSAKSEIEVSYGAYAYQRKLILESEDLLAQPGSRLMLHMPTGSGKTRTAMHVICRHLVRNEGTLVVWLANSEELCEQAAEEFEKAWASLGNRQLPVYRNWGSAKIDLSQVSDGFVIMGIQKVQALLNTNANGVIHVADWTSLVIFDEAHQAIAPRYREVLEAFLFRPRSPSFLGLTATPGRTWAVGESDAELADFFLNNRVKIQVSGFDNPIEFLVAEGFLAAADFQKLDFDSLSDGVAIVADDDRIAEIPPSILQQLGASDKRNILILARLIELSKNHQRIIYFAPSVENSDLMATILRARGIEARSVTSKSSFNSRQLAISSFKSESATPMILCNYGVLTTGFDAPKTSAVLIARPTKSLVLFSQMVGRAIRGPRSGGNSTAVVVTVVDSSIPGFGNVTDAFSNWDEIW